MVKIGYEGGGEIPGELKGLFTSTLEAQEAIKRYLAKKK